MQLCLFNEVLKEIIKETTIKGIWEQLKSLYTVKSVINKLHLQSRLYNLRLKEVKSLKPHLDEFYLIVMDLQNIEVKLNDKDHAIYWLFSSPPSYKHFRETLIYGRENLSSDNVKNALTQGDLIDSQLLDKAPHGSNDDLL